MKRIVCIFGIVFAIALAGCALVNTSTFDPNDPLLQDNLIEEMEGDPVVAPTTIHSTTNANSTQHSSFGDENYIWDNWSDK